MEWEHFNYWKSLGLTFPLCTKNASGVVAIFSVVVGCFFFFSFKLHNEFLVVDVIGSFHSMFLLGRIK